MNKKTVLKLFFLNLILGFGILAGITLNATAESKSGGDSAAALSSTESKITGVICDLLKATALKPLIDSSSCCHNACKDDFHEGFGNCVTTIYSFWHSEQFCNEGKGDFYTNKENKSTCDTAHLVVKAAGDICVSGICEYGSCKYDNLKRFCGYLCCNMTGQDLWHACLGGSCKHKGYIQPGCLKAAASPIKD